MLEKVEKWREICDPEAKRKGEVENTSTAPKYSILGNVTFSSKNFVVSFAKNVVCVTMYSVHI